VYGVLPGLKASPHHRRPWFLGFRCFLRSNPCPAHPLSLPPQQFFPPPATARLTASAEGKSTSPPFLLFFFFSPLGNSAAPLDFLLHVCSFSPILAWFRPLPTKEKYAAPHGSDTNQQRRAAERLSLPLFYK
jgi:hypothetical protein